MPLRYSAYYVRAPRLFRELHIARGDGSNLGVLARLVKIDLVAIDDLGLAPLTSAERHDLLELLVDRTERASTLVTSQIPVKSWHDVIGEPTLADAICDPPVHSAYVINLDGPLMRDRLPVGAACPRRRASRAHQGAGAAQAARVTKAGLRPPGKNTPSRTCPERAISGGRYRDTARTRAEGTCQKKELRRQSRTSLRSGE